MEEKIYDAYHREIELTKEQQACLKYTGDKTLMVKGFAGAGKSVVLMTIAKKYLDKYGRGSKNKVALFTYQNTLVSTMREFLQVNGQSDDGVVVSTVNSYIKEIYDGWVRKGIAPKRKYPTNDDAGKAIRINNVKKAISLHQTKYGKHRFHDVDLEFWLEEFDWMKNMNIWKDDLDTYLVMPRKGRGGKIRMSSSDRVTAYQMFVTYCNHLESTKQGDWADQTLFLIRHADQIPEDKKFEHILIDEAQDLSLAQMIAIMHLYNSDMVIAMDMNQKIHNRFWTPKLLNIDSTTKKLTKSMRTTVEIEALAESVRSKNDIHLSDDDKSTRAVPERSVKIPNIVHLESQAAERKYVVSLIRQYIKENPKITIGLIAAKNKQIKIFSDWLTSEGIAHEQVTKDSTFSIAKPGVKVVTAFGAKGLEFDCVIIPMFAEGYFPFSFYTDDQEAMDEFIIKMRNLVYVSMTRAKYYLTITFYGNKGSRFLNDMDSDLYEWIGEPFTPSVKTNTKLETVASTQTGFLKDFMTVPNDSNTNDATTESSSTLIDFLRGKGLEVIDKRSKGGALWVVGDKSLDPILKESRNLFQALWTYSERGGGATKHRSGWFTKSAR